MTSEPVRLDWDAVRAFDPASTVCWASRALVGRLRAELPYPVIESCALPPSGGATLVVVGGGALIDRAKRWRADASPRSCLVAVPSIWGSGADASPVVVFDCEGKKATQMGPQFLPDARVAWSALAALVPPDAARNGYGDTWSHALEAFFSPLADDALRREIASFVVEQLLPTPFEPLAAWFDLSARACWLQSRAGVGLVHGAAHELEPASHAQAESQAFTHAQLCSLLLWPVMRFNLARGNKAKELIDRFQLPWAAIDARICDLHDPQAFDRLLPLLESRWPSILRNPLTRLSAVLVRPDALAFFRDKAYEHAA